MEVAEFFVYQEHGQSNCLTSSPVRDNQEESKSRQKTSPPQQPERGTGAQVGETHESVKFFVDRVSRLSRKNLPGPQPRTTSRFMRNSFGQDAITSETHKHKKRIHIHQIFLTKILSLSLSLSLSLPIFDCQGHKMCGCSFFSDSKVHLFSPFLRILFVETRQGTSAFSVWPVPS